MDRKKDKETEKETQNQVVDQMKNNGVMNLIMKGSAIIAILVFVGGFGYVKAQIDSNQIDDWDQEARIRVLEAGLSRMETIETKLDYMQEDITEIKNEVYRER